MEVRKKFQKNIYPILNMYNVSDIRFIYVYKQIKWCKKK